MSIINRIATLTKAAIHEGLNKLEDPVLLTGQYLRDLEEQIANAERNQRELKVTAGVMERRLQEYRILAENSEQEAVHAMAQGNEEAARRAVLAKMQYAQNEQECTASLNETRQTIAVLEDNLIQAKEEQVRLKAKRAELSARARQANQTIRAAAPQHNTVHGYGPLNTGAATRGFERMEEKITEWEILAETKGTAPAAYSEYPEVNPHLSTAVDAELERLRSRTTTEQK